MHLLQIAGGQIWPNFLPLLTLKPDQVTFLTSADPKEIYKSSINKLIAALHDLNYKPLVDVITTPSPIPTKIETLQTITDIRPDFINLTGGTKVMSLAADEHARTHNITSFYIDTRRNSDVIELIHQGTTPLTHTDFSEIIGSIDVRIALKAQGFSVPSTFKDPPQNEVEFAREAAHLRATPEANKSISDAVKNLRHTLMDQGQKMFKKGKLRNVLQNPIIANEGSAFQKLLMIATKHGILESIDDTTYLLTHLDPITENADKLRSAADHNFKLIEGIWFELALLHHLKNKSSFTDICWSVEPCDGSANAIGETDLVAFNAHTLNLHFVSCKTSGPHSPLDHIQGLRRRATKEGGSHSKAELWIYAPRDDAHRNDLANQCKEQDVSLKIFTDEIKL